MIRWSLISFNFKNERKSIMKHLKRSMMTIAVLGMAFTGATGVYAGTQLQKINAYLNNEIGIQVNGKAVSLFDAQGNTLAPITYNNTTYLPVRALSSILGIPVTYDAQKHQVTLGVKAGDESDATAKLTDVNYSLTQIQEIKNAFANFPSFETAYAPQKMTIGDSYKQTAAGDDGVAIIFDHMRIYVSPRDYSDPSEGETIALPNGTMAKWYAANDEAGTEARLTFPLDDRFITISSSDRSLSQAQLEQVAVTVAKLK
jgi:hypothetical protein